MIYFDKPYATIEIEPESSLLILTWHGFASSDNYREARIKAIHLSRQYGVTRWLSNMKDMKAIRQADQEWSVNHWLPLFINLHLEKWAIIITDAMVMKGVTKYHPPGVAEVKALQAGNDILERLVSVPVALREIKEAIKRGEISQAEIDRRCKKILKAKLWVGLNNLQPIETKNLYGDLHSEESDQLNKEFAEASVTVLRNRNNILPLSWSKLHKNKTKVASLSFGTSRPTVFQKLASEQIQAPAYTINRKNTKARELRKLKKALRKYDLLLISIYGPSLRPSNNLGFGKTETDLLNELVRSGKAVVLFFDNAYALPQFEELKNARALVVGYQQITPVQKAAAKVVFGQLKPRGSLPVTVNQDFKYGAGLTFPVLAPALAKPAPPKTVAQTRKKVTPKKSSGRKRRTSRR